MKMKTDDPLGSPVSAMKAYGVTPRGCWLGGLGGDARFGTHIVGITSFQQDQ
jgi:hypothetical protein